nr:MAG TPA: hypothetical protein [Caudoviricetes sp.]
MRSVAWESIQKRPTLLWRVVGRMELLQNMLSLILTRIRRMENGY